MLCTKNCNAIQYSRWCLDWLWKENSCAFSATHTLCMLTSTDKDAYSNWQFHTYFISDTKVHMFYLQTPGLNIITEYVMGIVYPGRPIANVCFKVYGYMSMAQAVSFLSDFKLGHYMKIPPRSMFIVQVDCIVLFSINTSQFLTWCYLTKAAGSYRTIMLESKTPLYRKREMTNLTLF